MVANPDQLSSPNEVPTPTNDGHINPPAFLDLADSAARLNSNLPDINARIEQKRQEHERQRQLQRKHFEEQMRALEQKQLQEEQALLAVPSVDNLLEQHVALSAPTTPPRANSVLGGEFINGSSGVSALHHQAVTNGLADYKRKSVNYASGTIPADPPMNVAPGSHNHAAGAKSMPGSRRGSSGSIEGEDLTASLNLQSLSIKTGDDKGLSHPSNGVNGRVPIRSYTGPIAYNAASLFDEDLDNEISNSLKHLPTQTEDDRFNVRAHYSRKLSVSSAALDLAPLAQTQSRAFPRSSESGGLKSSEWPQFSGPPRPSDIGGHRLDRARSAHIGAIGADMSGTVSASATPLVSQSPDVSRRPSPPSFSDVSSLTSHTTVTSTRSVPATPLSNLSNSALRAELGLTSTKTPGAPLSPGDRTSTGAQLEGQRNFTPDLASGNFTRIPSAQYDNITFGSIRADEPLQSYGSDPLYLPNNSLDPSRYGSYSGGYSPTNRLSGGDIPGLYTNGSRYGLALSGGRLGGIDNKMNGLGGPKHKRGDIDREFNRFAGTRLEDLQGDIPALCKDQHGCRYLQKKLEEGVPEHRDMIFRETFGHLADLMTDPFGNYLCQKLLEYSTDEQRNVICESVAQDLVQISLNMHGTRAVQKMIDFLSTQRQNDVRYDAQIHSIIVALSLHVVTLIKDLNGNHVVQKCLNRLAPEDNQFIYNAVAAHCVEVATHRHGCCVLQRCVDHASDAQRVQLVTEITYNALTLVQDPYGNYVVQYILDLNDNRFSDAVIRQFLGNVCALSVQKFSSNVIEKCIRVAEHNTRKMLIEELLHRNRLEKLLRDSFGNYCVQTALDYAEPGQRMVLVEGIRPILPLIRNTPYGKRIQSKLQREQMEAAHASTHYGGGGGGYNHSHGHGHVNMTLAGNGRHHVPQQSLHHVNSLADPYGQRSQMYSLAQGGVAQHAIPGQLHPAQQLHHGLQQHSIDHGYSPQQHLGSIGLGSQSTIGASLGGLGATGFNSVNSYPSAIAAGNGFVGGGLSDPYTQRSAYPYAM